jgi:hypothetical protein
MSLPDIGLFLCPSADTEGAPRMLCLYPFTSTFITRPHHTLSDEKSLSPSAWKQTWQTTASYLLPWIRLSPLLEQLNAIAEITDDLSTDSF